jgi:hypothetical protein
MTMTLAVDPRRNDMVVGKNGKLLTTTSAQEVKQRILIALQHQYQEYFLNVPDGVPWYEVILGSKDKRTVESLIRSAILGAPLVLSVINLQIVWPSPTRERGLDFTAIVEVYGERGVEIIEIIDNNIILP